MKKNPEKGLLLSFWPQAKPQGVPGSHIPEFGFHKAFWSSAGIDATTQPGQGENTAVLNNPSCVVHV